jgi:hypothetical protein
MRQPRIQNYFTAVVRFRIFRGGATIAGFCDAGGLIEENGGTLGLPLAFKKTPPLLRIRSMIPAFFALFAPHGCFDRTGKFTMAGGPVQRAAATAGCAGHRYFR